MSSYRMKYKIGMTEYITTVPQDINEKVINKRVKITTSQTWTAPYTGWYKFTIKGAGGGGGGGHASNSTWAICGSGGGEGGTTFACEKMTVGDSAIITIGAGGVRGSVSSYGSDGGNSSVVINGKTFIGYGGKGGAGGYTYDVAGGAGGSGDIKGSPGSSGMSYNTGGYTLPMTAGGGSGGGTSGTNNAVDGGGGQGGNAWAVSSSVSANTGGKGGNGYVFIEYFDPTL